MAMEDETITARELITNLVHLDRGPERLKEDVAVNLTALCRISGKSITYLKRLECILTLPENAIEAVRNSKLNKTAPWFRILSP
jgi:hypothetical protein